MKKVWRAFIRYHLWSVSIFACDNTRDNDKQLQAKALFMTHTVTVLESIGTVNAEVLLNLPPTQAFSISYVLEGTAGNTDYKINGTSGEILFYANQEKATIKIDIYNDKAVEENET